MSADQQSPPAGPRADAPKRTLRLWAPALLMAIIVAALWSPNLMRPPPPAWTVYNNVKGQIRRVTLADKSLLRLNGASQVRVVYEDDDRRAAMGQAEAAFTIVPSTRRPFLIASGDRMIRIEGGEINILRETSENRARTVLTIRHGRARIYPDERATEGIDAGPGQQAAWVDGEAAASLRKVNPDNAFAWEQHRLVYDKAPLSEVVADLNRYVARPIRIGDPSLAALPYTGRLDLAGEDVMLRKIGETLPVEARPSTAEIVLQRATPKPPKPPKPKKKPAALVVQSLLKLPEVKPRPLPRPAPRAPAKAAPAPTAKAAPP